MPFDFAQDFLSERPASREARALRGFCNHHAGHVAERAVADICRRAGARIDATCWRGSGGEIDLIVTEPDGTTVFIEVKYARTHALAAERVTPAKIRRIQTTATEYLAGRHGHLDVDMRFDLALVDHMGRIDVIRNAFMD